MRSFNAMLPFLLLLLADCIDEVDWPAGAADDRGPGELYEPGGSEAQGDTEVGGDASSAGDAAPSGDAAEPGDYIPPTDPQEGQPSGTPPELVPGIWKDITPPEVVTGSNYTCIAQGMALDPANPSSRSPRGTPDTP